MKISHLQSLEILDSRGNPTVRTVLTLDDGAVFSASVPSGASTGAYEAKELRDNDPERYGGQGVLKAVESVNKVIAPIVLGMDVTIPEEVDKKMISIDGTKDKSQLGANAILSVSLATNRAAAHTQGIPLWKFINTHYFVGVNPTFPRFMVNIVNGGKHANWNFDIQEFMVVPKDTMPSKSLRVAAEIFHKLGGLLSDRSLSILLGDEGGYSPALNSNEEVLHLILEAAKAASYEQLQNFDLAIDVAASEWFINGTYLLHRENKNITGEALMNYFLGLQQEYKILSFEDPFAEDDWINFKAFTAKANFMVVGDDLYVTNPERLQQGIEEKATNAILIKPNQIGTIMETAITVNMARKAGMKTIISHRSGETEDNFIADLAYGSASDFIKTGSTARSERLSKYNRLLEIEKGI